MFVVNYRRMIARTCAIVLIGLMAATGGALTSADAEELKIAAASDLNFAMKDLVA